MELSKIHRIGMILLSFSSILIFIKIRIEKRDKNRINAGSYKNDEHQNRDIISRLAKADTERANWLNLIALATLLLGLPIWYFIKDNEVYSLILIVFIFFLLLLVVFLPITKKILRTIFQI
ncbi:hypothetical protein DENIS_2517 [Desulfonema ishimotonii]|uniref:Uncharacterized protein n=1 Tax=Desulfonema ishimotonii TaxID=45657 RepID=A0A401FX61_9BACT|nr:hypothetical protein DENIS_2517 [Desulfonema ishimotonii]